MNALDALLKLRPANAANRLRGRAACILNSWDVQRALAEQGRAVVLFELAAPALLAPSVLRAAHHLESVVGLAALVHPRGEGPAPQGWFLDAAAAAEEVGFRLPMFLASGPLPLAQGGEPGLEQLRRQVFEHLDAGFTEISLDAGGLAPEEAAALVADLGAPVRERELGLEVVAGGADDEALAELCSALEAQDARARVVSLPAGTPEDCELAALALFVGQAALGVREPAAALVAQRAARRVAAGERLDRLLEAALPAGLRGELDAWREEHGASLRAALGHFHRRLPEIGPRERLRLEALAYHEARELLEAAGARRSARLAVEFLTERSGY